MKTCRFAVNELPLVPLLCGENKDGVTVGGDILPTLAWLVEAGADEAVGEVPVNRFQAKASAAPSHPPLEGQSKFAERSRAKFGERSKPPEAKNHVSPKTPPTFSTFAQGEGMNPKYPGGMAATRRPSVTPTSVLNPHAHENDHIGRGLEIANACNSLVELKAALEAFDGCALKQFANTTVFADGNPAARIMFIGEAPGFEEDKTGLPFVGRAGKLLDKMLGAVGFDRSSAYIINVLPWRPPDNRNPDLTEVAKCIPFLRRHIELHAPEIVVLLGGSPLRHVLGKTEGILQSRGKWLQYHVAGRMVPVMPTLHPAYLLRQPAHKKHAWRDLLAIIDKLQQNHGLAG
ncbi:MAG: uracil-DNA glycosylase family protein [Rhizomicrobium sp.]|jgi:uracil-DNA glycosylase family 4